MNSTSLNAFAASMEDSIVGTSNLKIPVSTLSKASIAPATVAQSLSASTIGIASVIRGTSKNDFIVGDDTNDVIYGYGGNDDIIDDLGNDKLYGGDGNDTLDSGFGNDYLDGGNGNDVFRGLEQSDTIVGGAGNDTIEAGTGYDVIVFNAALNRLTNVDRVLDYNVAQDTIKLENAVFTKLTKIGFLDAGAFRIGRVAADATDRIIYDNTTGALYYDPDGNGAAAQIKFAQLNKYLSLKNTEFVVI